MPEASPPAEGGAAVQVTKKGGYVAFESADGEFVYHTKGLFDTSLWRRPVGGGEETEVLPSLTGNAFASVSKGIYFGEPNSDGSTSIQFFSFTTGKVITVTTIKRHGYRPVHFAGRKVHSLHASQSRQQQPDASGELWLMPP
jgi:hypothetical protein